MFPEGNGQAKDQANVLVNSDTRNVNDARDALLDEGQPESHGNGIYRISVPLSLRKAACWLDGHDVGYQSGWTRRSRLLSVNRHLRRALDSAFAAKRSSGAFRHCWNFCSECDRTQLFGITLIHKSKHGVGRKALVCRVLHFL